MTILAGIALAGPRAWAQAGASPELVSKAKSEGKVIVYSATDLAQAKGLLAGFKAAYPGVDAAYNEFGTTSMFNRIVSEAAAKQVGCDIGWSSGVDLQLTVVERGLAEQVRPPAAGKLPGWAIYKDAAYGTTMEPAAIIYNKRLLAAEMVPKSHADLLRILKEDKAKLDGKVATYDPEKSGLGYTLLAHDAENVPNFWDLMAAFGAAHGKVYGSSGSMREKVISGEHLLAFDVVGSYAMAWAKENENIAYGFLKDYVPAFSRPMLIPKGAPHPNAALLFLDFTLSAAGQKALSDGGLPALRTDVPDTENLDTLKKLVGSDLSPIPLSAKTLAMSDAKTRVKFFREWRKATKG
ncbi:MAG TPA: extracellular solute-binding protein [Acetobacteraceae bacterium]|nr:extracellular solute-binding protein [Acetobacteraceae bacterium]